MVQQDVGAAYKAELARILRRGWILAARDLLAQPSRSLAWQAQAHMLLAAAHYVLNPNKGADTLRLQLSNELMRR